MAHIDAYYRAEQVVECMEVTLDSGVPGKARASKSRRNAIQQDGELSNIIRDEGQYDYGVG